MLMAFSLERSLRVEGLCIQYRHDRQQTPFELLDMYMGWLYAHFADLVWALVSTSMAMPVLTGRARP